MRGLHLTLVFLLSLLLTACPKPAPPPGPAYSIHLNDVGPNSAAVVASVASIRGCSPKLAEKLVARKGPRSLMIRADVSQAVGEQGVAALEAAGAKATLIKIR